MKTTNTASEHMHSKQTATGVTAMTIDEDSNVFIMDMLGKLYARPAQAALREYLSNAQDAHVSKGGQLPPIQVTLPSAQTTSPNNKKQIFSVRDFGNGMSEEEFKTILSRYGKSTKRDTNTLIGGFGLGAKAGFALGDEFFMTSYQNGTGLRVRIFKNATNQGYVEIVERFQTAEADGMLVEVPVPSSNLSEFEPSSLKYFFWGYDSEKVEITPSNVDYLSVYNPDHFVSLELNNNVVGWLPKPDLVKQSTNLYAVVGSVTYKLRLYRLMGVAKTLNIGEDVQEHLRFFQNSNRPWVINLPIGSIDIPSSREEITLSERSVQTIFSVLSRYLGLVHNQLQSEINEMSYVEAMMSVDSLDNTSYYPRTNEMNWRGKKLGQALLSSSEACILRVLGASAERTVSAQIYNVSSLEADPMDTATFANITSRGKRVVFIPVESEEERERIKETFRTEEALDSLSLYLDSEGPAKNDIRKNTACIVMSKSDPLYEMFADAHVLELSVLNSILTRAEKRRQLLEEAKIARRKEREAAAEAKRLEEISMVTSFLLVGDDRQFLSRNKPSEVYGIGTEEKYYWSSEEVTQSSLTEDVTYAFPYSLPYVDISEELNLYQVLAVKGSQQPPNALHKNLRILLGCLLPAKSRIILIGSHINLEEYKAQHPEIKSGVGAVQSSLEEALKDESSKLSVLRRVLSNNSNRVNEVPRTLSIFNRALEDASHRESLNPDFLKIMEENARRDDVIAGGLETNIHRLNSILSVFAQNLPEPHKIMDEQAMAVKYPLLFNARSFDTIPVLEDMIEYINSKG